MRRERGGDLRRSGSRVVRPHKRARGRAREKITAISGSQITAARVPGRAGLTRRVSGERLKGGLRA